MQGTITITAAMRTAMGLAEDAQSSAINVAVKAAVLRGLGITEADKSIRLRRELAYLVECTTAGDTLTKVQAARLAWLQANVQP